MRALVLALTTLPAWAHDGHGPEGPHVHSWDSGATLALLAGVALALWWFSRGRK